MFPRWFVLCSMLLAPSLPTVGTPDVLHFGRNIMLPAEQRIHNATCFLCSVDVEGRSTGSIHVFAGNVFLNGAVAGNVLVFGGNVNLTADATAGGRVIIIGGHLRQEPTASIPASTVFAPIIFLPTILVVCAIIGGLIVMTRRTVRDPAYPRLPRL